MNYEGERALKASQHNAASEQHQLGDTGSKALLGIIAREVSFKTDLTDSA